ncbi:unnamed protein product [Nippostrongylus brasiliensis]|uniref:Alpha-mannosidase n=1 Tax=Nippostrongylus brasiliensis TaxID=27835 RepID=A0A0N4YBC4_NIPBR|nr:unnamed protein product [Nippostrongylus brasiliensis]
MVRPIFRRKFRYIALITTAIFVLLYTRRDTIPHLKLSTLPKYDTSLHTTHLDTTEIAEWEKSRKEGRAKPQENVPPVPHEELEIIVVPFSHADPGWLKTFDSYSNDTNRILSSAHEFLMANKDVTFLWAETIFLERWWLKQNDSVKRDMRNLVKEKRLDLVTGSWVMSDEATVYYPTSVDNIVEGFHFIHNEFGMKPSLFATLDPFGLSNSMAYLYTQAGVHREVINRVSAETKEVLRSNRGFLFNWQQYFDDSKSSAMLTHLLYAHYDIWSSCGPDSKKCCQFDIWTNKVGRWCSLSKEITLEDAEQKANTFVEQLKIMAGTYTSNVVMMLFGDDFRFSSLEEWEAQYSSLQRLFDEINKRDENIRIRFGTVSAYFDELEASYKSSRTTPPSLTGDFFPYQTSHEWTGYYSTRPFFKAQERRLLWMLHTADLLFALRHQQLPKTKEISELLKKARRVLLLFQHHDAITGTSRKHVMQDYSKQLHEAALSTESVIKKALAVTESTVNEFIEYIANNNATTALKVLKITDKQIFVSILNTLPYRLEDIVSVRVNSSQVGVVQEDGKPVESQLDPYINRGEIDNATFLLSFRVRLLPLAKSTFILKSDTLAVVPEVRTAAEFVNKISNNISDVFKIAPFSTPTFSMKGGAIESTNDALTGGLMGVTVSGSKTRIDLGHEFLVYSSSGGPYSMSVSEYVDYFSMRKLDSYLFVQGPVQDSVHIFTKGLYYALTLKKVGGVQGEQLHYSIHLDVASSKTSEVIKPAGLNHEVAFGLKMPFNESDFYTDSIGLQLLRRRSETFFPMATSAVVEHNEYRITINTNVPHACRLTRGGTVETIIDRSIHTDDGFGLADGLADREDAIANDNLPVDMKFTVLVENQGSSNSELFTTHTPAGHLSVQSTLYPPVVLVGAEKPVVSTFIDTPPAPCHIQLVNVRLLPDGKHLLTIFVNGVTFDLYRQECGNDIKPFLRSYLKQLDVKKLQTTDLSGIDRIGPEINVDQYSPEIVPFKFLSLLLTI